MFVTEAEALTKWCPFSRVFVFSAGTAETREVVAPPSPGGPGNRYMIGGANENSPDGCRCIGTQCMAWIWVGPPPVDPTARRGGCGMVRDPTN